MPKPICFMLLIQEALRAFSRARAKTGNRIAAKIAMIAMTTKSSIRVKADFLDLELRVAMIAAANKNTAICIIHAEGTPQHLNRLDKQSGFFLTKSKKARILDSCLLLCLKSVQHFFKRAFDTGVERRIAHRIFARIRFAEFLYQLNEIFRVISLEGDYEILVVHAE